MLSMTKIKLWSMFSQAVRVLHLTGTYWVSLLYFDYVNNLFSFTVTNSDGNLQAKGCILLWSLWQL